VSSRTDEFRSHGSQPLIAHRILQVSKPREETIAQIAKVPSRQLTSGRPQIEIEILIIWNLPADHPLERE
jgi:hypothetical protein